jgi:hypothetical protein
MKSFLMNVYDYTMCQSGAGVSAVEKILRYVFSVDSRSELMYYTQYMIKSGDVADDVQAALNSSLPKAVSIALDSL